VQSGRNEEHYARASSYIMHLRQNVAREGIAPSTSLCKRDMILFHHRAEKIGCRGWNRTRIHAFKGRCPTIGRLGNWWPARVTRPVLRIKSPLHHFNACKPANGWCSRQDLHLHWRRSRRRASSGWATRAKGMEPPAGAAPARILYKRNLQAAAGRRGSQPRCSRGCEILEPPPGVAPSSFPYQRNASLKMLWGHKEVVGAESAALSASRMSNERSAGELRSRNWYPQPDSHRQPDA
jgi:hypothetical protein